MNRFTFCRHRYDKTREEKTQQGVVPTEGEVNFPNQNGYVCKTTGHIFNGIIVFRSAYCQSMNVPSFDLSYNVFSHDSSSFCIYILGILNTDSSISSRRFLLSSAPFTTKARPHRKRYGPATSDILSQQVGVLLVLHIRQFLTNCRKKTLNKKLRQTLEKGNCSSSCLAKKNISCCF